MEGIVEACKTNDVEMLKRHLKRAKKINLNARPWGSLCTPLTYACTHGSIDVVKFLLAKKRVDVNRPEVHGLTPFIIACNQGNVEIAKLLMADKRVDIHKKKHPDGGLHNACNAEHSTLVKFLITDKRVDVNQRGWIGLTPLHYSCMRNDHDTVRILLSDKRVNVNILNSDNLTPFEQACQSVSMQVIKFLLCGTRKDMIICDPSEWFRPSVNMLLVRYHENPVQVKEEFRREFGIDREFAGILFAIISMKMYSRNKFFYIVSRLPTEMKMKTINMVYGMDKDFISQKDISDGLEVVKNWK